MRHPKHYFPDSGLRHGKPFVASVNHKAMLTPVLQNRRLTIVLVLAAALQTGLTAMGLSAWSCPFHSAFFIPCPACGMTSGAVLLLKGQWASALQTHLFSPLLIAGTAAAGLVALMPDRIHRRLIDRLEALERRTGVTVWIGVCFGVSWIWRMVGGI
jgi:hypothetical protein